MKNESPLDFTGLVAAFEERLYLKYPIGVRRQGVLEIDGRLGRLNIRWPKSHTAEPDSFAQFKNLEVADLPADFDGGPWVQLGLNVQGSPEATLAFASTVVGSLNGEEDFSKAIGQSISSIKALLQEFEVLSEFKVIGLIGELLVVLHLASVVGSDFAARAWLGPPRGEHDFSLETCDLEVKTTTSEKRLHRITSETQLVPSEGRDLYLLSIQLTAAGLAEPSFSLPELIEEARSLFPGGSNELELLLHEAGWRDWYSEFLDKRYRLRSSPQAYRIDEAFPAITPEIIRESVDHAELVQSVKYSVDVSSLEPDDSVAEIQGMVGGG